MSRILNYFTSTENTPPPSDVELRAARLRAARANPRFEEIEDDLVARGRLFVSVSTDAVLKPARGAIFETGSASIIAVQPLAYTVDEDGTLTFYEVEPQTWSEMVAVRARRRIKRPRR